MLEIIISVSGFIGSIITVISFFKNDKNPKMIKGIFIFLFIIITLLSITNILTKNKYDSSKTIENQANKILESSNYNDDPIKMREYIMECYTFIEVYQHEIPDKYERAKLIVDQCKLEERYLTEKMQHYKTKELQAACAELTGIIKGLAKTKE